MISLTLSLALSQPGMKPHSAPPSIPATSIAGMMIHPGAVGGVSAATAAAGIAIQPGAPGGPGRAAHEPEHPRPQEQRHDERAHRAGRPQPGRRDLDAALKAEAEGEGG